MSSGIAAVGRVENYGGVSPLTIVSVGVTVISGLRMVKLKQNLTSFILSLLYLPDQLQAFNDGFFGGIDQHLFDFGEQIRDLIVSYWLRLKMK